MINNINRIVRFFTENSFSCALNAVFIPSIDNTADNPLKIVTVMTPHIVYNKLMSEYISKEDLSRVCFFNINNIRYRLFKQCFLSCNTKIISVLDLKFLVLSLITSNQLSFFNYSSIYNNINEFIELFYSMEVGEWREINFQKPSVKSLIIDLKKKLIELRLVTIAYIDVRLSLMATKNNLVIVDNIIIFGFSSFNWSSYPVLNSILLSFIKSSLFIPFTSNINIDSMWYSAWKKTIGQIDVSSFALKKIKISSLKLSQNFNYNKKGRLNSLNYIVDNNIINESFNIVKIVQCISSSSIHSRIAIIYSGNTTTPLLCEVIFQLEKRNIYFSNNNTNLNNGNNELFCQMRLWIDLQKLLSVSSFMHFLQLLLYRNIISIESFQVLKKSLKKVFFNTCSENIKVLFAYSRKARQETFLNFIESFPLIFNHATSNQYLKAIYCNLRNLDCIRYYYHMLFNFNSSIRVYNNLIKRETLLKWIDSVLIHKGIEFCKKETIASNVDLLSEDQYFTGRWTTVIAIGMNKNFWLSNNQSDKIDHYSYQNNSSSILSQKPHFGEILDLASNNLYLTASFYLDYIGFGRSEFSDFFDKLHWADNGLVFSSNLTSIDIVDLGYQSRGMIYCESLYKNSMICNWSYVDSLSYFWLEYIFGLHYFDKNLSSNIAINSQLGWIDYLIYYSSKSLKNKIPSEENWTSSVRDRSYRLFDIIRSSYKNSNIALPGWFNFYKKHSNDIALRFVKKISNLKINYHMIQTIDLPYNYRIKISKYLTLRINKSINLMLSAYPVNDEKFYNQNELWFINFTFNRKYPTSRKVNKNKLNFNNVLCAFSYQQQVQKCNIRLFSISSRDQLQVLFYISEKECIENVYPKFNNMK